ncbi:MAG: hypothetical protein PHX88_11930 [Methanoculleus horonobensis]|nr:hypothetical protein [Methanoculleus horonobensis]
MPAAIAKTDAAATYDRAQQDPVWWVETILGDRLWQRQRDIIESVRDNPETAVKSCHGPGKSFTAARVALWFLYTHRPSIVITTAPTDRQVRGILWKEIRAAHARSRYPLGGNLLSQELKLDSDWWAWGFTAPDYDPDRFQGFHEVHILVIVDEAAGVSDQIFEGIDGVLTSDRSRLLMIGNPTSATGRFAEAFKTPGIAKITISAFDTPNFTTFGITEADIATGAWEEKVAGQEMPFPYLVTPQWAAKRYERWGPDSPLYQARVLGNIPQVGDDTLIPLHWIEAATQRTLEPSSPNELGVDVARHGSDETVIVHRRGPVARLWKAIPMGDTMETVGQVQIALRETGAGSAQVDTVGLGAGVYDRLKELGAPAHEMNSGDAASDSERYANARAEWWWGLRSRFEAGEIDIDGDEELVEQLANIKYKVNSRGQILIESKEEMKKRGRKSPDRGDALMLAFATPRKKHELAFYAL